MRHGKPTNHGHDGRNADIKNRSVHDRMGYILITYHVSAPFSKAYSINESMIAFSLKTTLQHANFKIIARGTHDDDPV
jgi:hypothetical protein